MAKTNCDTVFYGVGDTFDIRRGDRLNIGVPEYIVFHNSTSPVYVLTNNIIMIGSMLKPDRKYTGDDLFVAITESIYKTTGISPNKNNSLTKSVDRLILDIEKAERKITRIFDSSVFIGDWTVDSIEKDNDSDAQCIVKITKVNNDGSVMHNLMRIYGNERMQFRY